MSSIEIKNAENQKKLKRVKAFAIPCLLLCWASIFISIWAIFSGNGFLAFGGVAASLVIGFFTVFVLLVLVILGCIRIKTCANIYKLKDEDGGLSKKYDLKSENKTYMVGLAYLDRMEETIRLAMWMTIGILFLGIIVSGSNPYNNGVWAVVLSMLSFAYLLPNIYWKVSCNLQFSWSFVWGSLIDLLKVGLLIGLIIVLKNLEIKELFTEIGIGRIDALMFISVPDASPEFMKSVLTALGGIPECAFLLIVFLKMLDAPLEDVIEKKAKRLMIWCIILMAIDVLLFMFVPSTYSIMESLGRWFAQARLWWIPIILLLIALQVANIFPTGKDIYDDLRQALNKGEIVRASEKAETEQVLAESDQSVKDIIQ